MALTRAAGVPHGPRADVALRVGVPLALLLTAAFGWWWSVRMADRMGATVEPGMGEMSMSGAVAGHSMSFAGFALAWVAMMAAMMFPAISPVVRLYGLAAAKGRVAPLPFFVIGYLVVWASLAVPGYVAWRALEGPLLAGEPWIGRLAGGVLLAAAAWQFTPLKSLCLRHCRSPLSFFLQYGGRAGRPSGALAMGFAHGSFCVGCCWALMAVLVAMGTMHLGWMFVLAGFIFLEKNAPAGQRIATVGAAGFALAGSALLVHPELITSIT